MADHELGFWEAQFPTDDERRKMAMDDPDIKRALRLTSPSERAVSGDGLLALEHLAAEKHGLDTLETSRLLEGFWELRDAEDREYYGEA